MRQYSYAAEKFAQARRNLMLPHPSGESESIMLAFHGCSLALHNLAREGLDDDVHGWLRELEELMSTKGMIDSGKGLWIAKAERLSVDDKITLSNVIDELAYWFYRASHEY